MIVFRHFALRRGSRLLLSDLDATLQSGWRLGIIGRNGCGKSSLFAALQGELEPDAGELELPAKLRWAAVAQETPALSELALDYVVGGDEALAAALQQEAAANSSGDAQVLAAAHQQLEAIGGYDGRARAGRLLHGLGFAPETHYRPVKDYSGGWRVRLNLARALMCPSDLLLLDEPTNHLDLDAVLWLETWLRRYQGTLLIISHDREFLDAVIDHTLHLVDGEGKIYPGHYSDFERQRAEFLRQRQLAHQREQAERAHLQRFVDRFKAKASKARQAQSRLKRLEKLVGAAAVRAERSFHFSFPAAKRLPASMLQLEALDAGYSGETGQPHTVLRDVQLRLEAGDRIGLLGPNGAGKSTLVKTLVGELAPLAGERKTHQDLRIGYFAQHTVESLSLELSPFEHLQQRAPAAAAQALRDFLGGWQFAGERAFEPVEGFSGGERARLALALIAWDHPNLLLLDEPTNHLDLDMREALAEALATFEGALVLVSHDRHLLGLVCDRLLKVADGSLQAFDGDLDDYAVWLRSRNAAVRKSAPAPQQSDSRPDPATRRREQAARRETAQAARQQVQKIERHIAILDQELARLTERLTDPEIYSGPTAELMRLGQAQQRLRKEKETLEAEWLVLYAQLEG